MTRWKIIISDDLFTLVHDGEPIAISDDISLLIDLYGEFTRRARMALSC